MNTSSKFSLLAALLLGSTLSMNANAIDSPALLAGIEAGLDSDTVMTAMDLNKTQVVLHAQPTGAKQSWYNIDTTTHFDIVIGQHFSRNQRPCVAYHVTVKHNSKTENKDLNACLDYDSKWISQSNKVSMK